MVMETLNLELPSHWASALINSDDSGLDEFEIESLDAFTEWMLDHYGQCVCIDVEDGSFFSSWHDASNFNVLPCDVSVFTFDVTSEEDDGQPTEMEEWASYDPDC